MIRRRFPCRGAFSLLELLVVTGIVAILVALLLPAVQKARTVAGRAQCQNNLKQLGLALMSYESSYKQLPPAGKSYNCGKPVDGDAPQRDKPAINLNGLVLLLPFLEKNNLYNEWDQKSASSSNYLSNGSASWPLLGDGASAANIALAQTLVPNFICPLDNGNNKTPANRYYGVTSSDWGYKTNYDFIANGGGAVYSNYWKYLRQNKPRLTYIFGENSSTRLTDIVDGTSNTLAMGETTFNVEPTHHGNGWNAWAYRVWCSAGIDPNRGFNAWDSYGEPPQSLVGTAAQWGYLASLHVGGANVCMADGSVHFLSQTTDKALLRHLSTMAGGEVATLP